MTLHGTLIATNSLLHVSTAGAGAAFLGRVWQTPGVSKYLVGAVFAYGRTQMHSLLGYEPKSYVSRETALEMAMSSYLRAVEHKVIENLSGEPVGLAITAAVASSTVGRGKQRVDIAVISKNRVITRNTEFEKGVGELTRAWQDSVIADCASELLMLALGQEVLDEKYVRDSESLALELFHQRPVFCPDGTRKPPRSGQDGFYGLYLPATLNPIHDGHRAMCAFAERQLDSSRHHDRPKALATYLVSSTSPHKGSLTIQDLLYKAGMIRAERWKGETRVLEFTPDEPLFLDKARKRPGSHFIVGADTMERMLDPKWGLSIGEMLDEMETLGTCFLVLGRYVEGVWKTADDIEVPDGYRHLFRPLEGRVDISSTEIRDSLKATP